jgi:hypothetical protein
MTHRTPEEIRAKFADLHRYCDPRGTNLLDELEKACLRDQAMLAFNANIRDLEHRLAHSFAPGDVDSASAESHEPGLPTGGTVGAGAEVIDLNRYSWRVEGGAA